ncbi:MAG: hypothetical protein HY836_12340 [Aquabacterium sp.]|uniref:HzsA-related protein n=1 Tax=Aquabacterium sp. TaxID=1872578 RepID=UPI0025B9122B|nr:hypothetical protein [Aquabacterium sp.]MBI5926370.1 hypothetical protein [Aquabacterium sp.]
MKLKRPLSIAAALAALLSLPACMEGSSSSESNASTSSIAIPIAYAKRANTIMANPTNGAPTAPGGDLIIRDVSSPSAPEYNITERFTQGQGDASGPEVSYDGKKLVFAMRCPDTNTAMINLGEVSVRACTGRWNIWEYDMSSGGLTGGTFRRLTASMSDDDVDPTYLPGGRGVVFTSNRQTKSRVNQFMGQNRRALDEYEREPVFNLHTMDADGGSITQISFNQSHDRSPVVRQNGEIMFSRWDHVGGRNHFKIFRIKPDGTDLFVLYGAHSDGNSFLHPREMDPNSAKYKGFVASDVMPLSGTREGGALMFVDVTNFSEQHTPVNSDVTATSGQSQPTAEPLNFGRGLSNYGRITTPYPLWDGTDRLLVSFAPCRVHRNGAVIPCAKLSDDEKRRLAQEDRPRAEVLNDEVQDDVPPAYGIYMFDPARSTLLNVASPPEGFMYTHPVALQPRTEPGTSDPTNLDEALAADGEGIIEVRSVYDTDELGRMGDAVLLDGIDNTNGCTTPIPKIAPPDPRTDTRPLIPDLLRMKNPADPAYGCAPARFIRVFRAVAPPEDMTGTRDAIGETDFEMQQILGYAPIEPDGSFKLRIPADTPIGLAVVDAEGRAFQTHTNWIQVRPGERRTCDGCHSPRRGGAINAGSVVNAMPDALKTSLMVGTVSRPIIKSDGETLAGIRTRLDPSALLYSPDLIYTDIWADTSKNGVTARAPITLNYDGLDSNAKPSNGIINYPEHIQPLWTTPRGTGGVNTCTTCHNAQAKLDLSGTTAGTGRMTSYQELMVGDPIIDPATGRARTRLRSGIPVIERGPALVNTSASEGEALGLSRASRLTEILWGKNMAADADARTAHPTPPNTAPNHATLLNASEKRLLAEWMDLGGKYYNDPFNANTMMRPISGLNRTTFDSQVFPILQSTCASGCHQAIGSSNSATPGTALRDNRFVLTGDKPGDYNVTLTMITDACTEAANALLSKPSSLRHPDVGVDSPAILPVGSTAYNTIANWIRTGCRNP